ncbi:hypothetical protein GCM10027187_40000 [Streptosporangium sandarakinum]|uniref:DOD-type homing endonuclease domain-containing protein n=1 Tax=Streptosporangium sandarakinum TaxID=1260955 RepID=A0A852VAU0_9ACTN|nr:LAGLIDADG family homing endonuclease [Streptosporangium sandarakinum]NYF44668.1 hypothetical protein [Streptosporangium sandarakinum]
MAVTAPTAIDPPGDKRSRTANRMFAELMDLPAEERRLVLEDLSDVEARQVYAAAYRAAGTSFALWADDPVGFVEQVLGAAVWSVPRQFMTALTEHKQVAVPSCFGSSKCVPHDEYMQLADGSVVTAADLVMRREFHVLGWQEDGTQTVRRARAEWNQIEPVYRLTSESGRTIVRNGHHPLWAARAVRKSRPVHDDGTYSTGLVPENIGWKSMADLDQEHDLVLVPEVVNTVGDGWMRQEEAAVLGYLLGDGGTTHGIRFSQMPGPALDEFIQAVESLGARTVVLKPKPGQRHVEVVVRNTDDVKTNPVLTLARQWGIFGCKATEKRVPAEVFRMHPSVIATVVGRLFSCDGYVHVRTERRRKDKTQKINEAYIAMTLSNEGLIRDFQRLMLRLGIPGTVRPVKGDWQGKAFTAWQWVITTAKEILRFAELIDAPAKNEKVQLAAEVAGRRKFTWQWQYRDAPPGYRWERIQSVEELPPTQTVAIEVDVDHTWVDLFVEHNTFSCGQLVLWASLVYPVGTNTVVTLAPLWRQVARQLWPEVRAAHTRARLPGTIDMAQYKLPDANGLDTVVAYGIAAAPHNEAAVQGIHAANLLLVVEEAGGIAHTIGNNLAGLLVGEGAKMIAIGNPPTDEVGTWFEKLCADPEVKTIPISAFSTPNLTGEDFGECQSCPGGGHSPAKHMVDAAWIDRTTRVHGPKSNYVRAKIHALFPKGLANVVIPSDWVQAAVDAEEPEPRDGWVRLRALNLDSEDGDWVVQAGAWVRLGVDVAADGGDELVVARLVGDLATVEHSSSGPENADPVAVAGMVLTQILRAEAVAAALGSRQRVRVKVDGNGLGWGVAGLLAAWGREGRHDAEIVSVLVSESPGREPDEATLRPYRKRDEMWLAGRALVRPDEYGVTRLRLRVDDMTAAQLSAPKLATNSSGYSVVESKPDMKKRGVSSPDRGEAILLAVYEPAEEGDAWRIIV